MNQEKKEVIENIKKVAKEIAGLGGKSVTAKMPTIWEKDKYKVSINFKDSETHHNKDHVHLNVSKGKEKGVIAIEDGEVLDGNLKQDSVNWCRKTILTEENKKRIKKMIEKQDFYRLDRKNEMDSHEI